MEFKIASSILNKYMQDVSRILLSKPSNSILEYIRLTAADGKLRIEASDGDNNLMAVIDNVQIDQEGSIAIPASNIVDSLKEYPNVDLKFVANEETYKIYCSYESEKMKGMFDINGASTQDMPELDESVIDPDDQVEFRLKCDDLVTGIVKTVKFATTQTDNQQFFAGVLIEAYEDETRFIGCDGNCLSMYRRLDIHGKGVHKALIVSRLASLLASLLGRTPEEELLVRFDSRKLLIQSQSYTLLCSLSTYAFPDYMSVIPQNNPYTVKMDRELLSRSIRQVSPFSTQGNNYIRMDIMSEGMKIQARNLATNNEAKVSIGCEFNGDSELQVYLTTKYISEAAAAIEAPEIVMTVADPPSSQGCVLTPSEQDNENVHFSITILPLIPPKHPNDDPDQ